MGTAYLGWGWSEAVALARALDRAVADLEASRDGLRQ